MPERSEQGTKNPLRRRVTLVTMAIVAGLAVGFAAVYGIVGFKPNGDPACVASAALLQQLKPLARGEVAAVNVPDNPLLLPNLAFHDAEGQIRHLTDWRGRTVLLNLWATWCAPCRKEMPALDALQKNRGSDRFQVVAVNVDTGDDTKPRKFLQEISVGHLGLYRDNTLGLFEELKRRG